MSSIHESENSPSKNDIAIVVSILKKLNPGLLPKDIFQEVTRLWVTSIVEVVPLRQGKNGQVEILLLSRPNDDPNWPGMLHTPGTVLRATDVEGGINSAFERIFSDEIGITTSNNPIFVKTIFHKVNRGAELASIYYINIGTDQPTNGKWYNENNLPNNLVDTQFDFIEFAINEFKHNEPIHE